MEMRKRRAKNYLTVSGIGNKMGITTIDYWEKGKVRRSGFTEITSRL